MALLAGFYRPGSYELPEMDVVVASTAGGVHWFEQNALGRCVYIDRLVTFTAVYFNMAVLQRKTRLVVIKPGVLPVRGLMARLTASEYHFPGKLSLMNIFMTSLAGHV